MNTSVRLLQTEIDVVPGRKPQQPASEGMIGPGSAVLRITNTTSQENSYTIRVKCDNPYWNESWCTVAALPPAYGNENAPPPGKGDQVGPHGRSVRIFVSTAGTRDVHIQVQTPLKPDARCGQYDLIVQVETSVSGDGSVAQRRERFTELPATAIIRPYYKWSMDVLPEAGRHVSLLRRTTELQVVVTNEGNDWLYCDVKTPKPKDLLLSTPVLRLAVPPPEPGETSTQRTVPLHATTLLNTLRGDLQTESVAVITQRVDAPSVPPLPDDAMYNAAGAALGSAVLMTETSETRQAPADRTVSYGPPIPSTLTGLISALGQHSKGLAMGLIGIIVAGNMLFFTYEQMLHSAIEAEPLSSQVAPGGKLVIGGRYLNGARVLADGKTPLESRLATRENNTNPIAESILKFIPTNDQQYLAVTVPETYNGQKVKLTVQRGAGIMSYLSPILPKYDCRTEVQVGAPPKAAAVPDVIPVSGSYVAGQGVEVLGNNLGSGGKVYLGGKPDEHASWSSGKIHFTVPQDALPGSTLGVVAITPDGKQLSAGTITVVQRLSAAEQQAQQVQQLTLQKQQEQLAASGPGPVTPVIASGGAGAAVGTGGAGAVHEHGADVPISLEVEDPYVPLLHEQFNKALSLAEDAIRQNDRDGEAHAIKAYILTKQGKAEQALAEAVRAEELTHSDKEGRPRALALTAIARLGELKNSADDDKVLQDYFDAIKADPTVELPFIAAAGYLAEKNELFIAENYLELALKVCPNPGIIHFKLAQVEQRLNKTKQARQNAYAARKLMPEVADIPSFESLAKDVGLSI